MRLLWGLLPLEVQGVHISPVTAGQPDLAEDRTSIEIDARDCIAAKAGDAAAMARLYTRYGPVVHAIVLVRIGHTEADDVTQDVFMRAMRSLSSLKEPTAFAAWLCTIARNEVARLMKQRKSQSLKLTGFARQQRTQTVTSPSSSIESHEALDAIRSLPEAYQETLILRLVEGLTGPEIAQRTGLTHGSVRVNLTRGMQMLRELFTSREGA